ncbi:unnamed protein product [Caenorhabditis auriculariae]|uniref:Uncharacterized protein n=1 Tax=Caenorhabditis auriculariae TaxID=2777116 RepID=A0A8S1H6D8_9PELO|nr:unnamed protein product [Caenorhabditis auriculariae]
MADEDDDIEWIREEAKESTPLTPATPATVVNSFSTDFVALNNPKTIEILAPEASEEEKPRKENSPPEVTDSNLLSAKGFGQPPDTPTSIDDSISFDISECERQLNNTTAEAKELLQRLGEKTQLATENNAKISQDLAEAQNDARKVRWDDTVHKTIDDHFQVPPPPELPSGGLPRNVESVLVGEGLVEAVTGTLVLPNGLVLVTDEVHGVLLFDIQGGVVAKVNPPEFKRFTSPVYHKEHILMLADAKDNEGHCARFVIKFSLGLQYVGRIECPKWLQEHTILRERLSIAHTDFLYLCVCGEIFSGLYELTPVGQWTELEYKLSEAYIDMLAFATVGPITQLLVVEGRKNYVLLISVRESQIVDRKRMAICERPGALARDEAGRLFVANRSSASIQLVDTMKWASARNVAITDAMVRHFTACWGLLAIPLKHAIRLQRYSFR